VAEDPVAGKIVSVEAVETAALGKEGLLKRVDRVDGLAQAHPGVEDIPLDHADQGASGVGRFDALELLDPGFEVLDFPSGLDLLAFGRRLLLGNKDSP
jgi:hypothetical protein